MLAPSLPRQKCVFLFFFCTLLAAGARPIYADSIYYYEDDQGTVRFSDEPPEVKTFSVRNENVTEAFRVAIKEYTKDELRAVIRQLSQQLNMEPALVEAIVKAESEYDTTAVSKRGARGLMQLMPETAKSLGCSNLQNPIENLSAGMAHLKRLLDHFEGNVDLAVAAYNAGAGAVEKHNGIPPFRETIDYVNKVRKYYAHFVELASRSAYFNAAKPSVVTQ